MNAEIVAVGTELLLGEIVNTNATYLSEILASLGINVYYHTVVGDNMNRMVDTIKTALSRSQLVITTGGLGPTADDITRRAVAAALNRPVQMRVETIKAIEDKFRSMHRVMSKNNCRQGEFPQGARIIPNPVGTAPGFIVEEGSRAVVCLPGVPREMRAMVAETVKPYLQDWITQSNQPEVISSKVLRFIGIGESALEEKIADIIAGQANPTVAPYASSGEVRLRLTAKAPTKESALALIEPLKREIISRVGRYLYGEDDDTLEVVVARLLWDKAWTVAIAESCTGGLIGHRLTEVPGSSRYLDRGFITYSNEAKKELLGVPEDILRQYGAVSEQTARKMATGAKNAAGSNLGLAVTGIAGPGGGSETKPVGLVYIAIDGPYGNWCEKHNYIGTRSNVKLRASQTALDLIRRYLLSENTTEQ